MADTAPWPQIAKSVHTRRDGQNASRRVSLTSVSITLGRYIDGHLTIEADIGCVRFKAYLLVKGSIFAKAGSGIKAGLAIIAKNYLIAAAHLCGSGDLETAGARRNAGSRKAD